jgi:cytohesin
VVEGDAERLAALIAGGADLDENCADGTPLIVAVQDGRLDLVKLLVEAGADVNVDFDPGNPLQAAIAGDAEMVGYLAARSRPEKRAQALTLAVREGRSDLVGLLLDAGAGVDADLGGGTPLTMAAERGDRALFDLLAPHAPAEERGKADRLLANRSRLEGAGGPEIRAFLKAAMKGRIKEIRKAIRAGVDVEATDEYGMSALHLAAWNGHPEAVRALLHAGAAVDPRDNFGMTPLIRTRAPEVVALLAAAGADVAAVDHTGSSALYEAIREGHAEAVRALLAAGADPNERRSGGLSLLHRAVTRGDAAILELLTEAGADLDARDDRDLTPLELLRQEARMARHAEALLAWKASLNRSGRVDGRVDAMITAAGAGRTEEVLALAREGADVNGKGDQPGRFGTTPLYAAAAEGQVETVRALLAVGARPEETTELDRDAPLFQGTALGVAAHRGLVEVARALLAAGADPDGRADPSRRTPLMMAAAAGQAETVRRLLEAGAEVNLAIVSNTFMTNADTAHSHAIQAGHQDVVDILLQAGAIEVDRESKWPPPRPDPGNPFIR